MIGYNNTIKTKRPTTTDGKTSYPSSYNLQNVDCYIEQASPEVVAMLGDIPAFHAYTMITDGVQDIKIGDLVIDSDLNEFKVSGVNNLKNNNDVPNHTEVLMQIDYNDE